MGIETEATTQNKRTYLQLIQRYNDLKPDNIRSALLDFLHPQAKINVVQPINSLTGAREFIDRVLDPLLASFKHLYRRADMLFGGEYQGAQWVVSHGHFVGRFERHWMGIPASGEIVWLHYVEYHRMADNRAVETYLFIDMLDLLRQIGRWPLKTSIGYEGFVPGPATADGLVLSAQDPAESAASLTTVDKMLAELWKDEQAWRDYWHQKMYWYGPSGYGSQIGIDGFERFQLPYEAMFSSGRFSGEYRKSGVTALDSAVKGHFARFADGNYVASGGWPSHGGFMARDWLGCKARDQMFTVRVADIWRRAGPLLVENWVFVDIVDMLKQLGHDAFAEVGIQIEL